MPVLTRFRATPPRYAFTQPQLIAWLVRTHADAEATARGLDDDARAAFAERIGHAFARCGCPATQIATRGLSIADPLEARDLVYDGRRVPHGPGTTERTQRCEAIVDAYFDTFEAEGAAAPDDLIHVTCTGYISPSGAQKLVSRRRWPTRVTHAYHMGCYAALPAVRIARGLDGPRVDIVHTELCSLHLDPSDHRLDQLVVQSLFADGFIRYSLERDDRTAGLRVLAVHEAIVPDSTASMSWRVGDHGNQMTLARDVPERIAGAIRGFVVELFRRGGIDLARMRDAAFAVHPGGPKIIDRVRDLLELSEAQVAASRRVLREHGNMSSATLPHVWMALLADGDVPRGTLVPSLAFGPGLTVCGALFEKR